jgi:hypothetical protein
MRLKRSIAIPLLITLALVGASALALPAIASADRAAIRAERSDLRNAVERSRRVPQQIRRGSFVLRRARMSTRGRWALSTVAPTGRLRGRLDAVTALFEHRRGAWQVFEIGTAGVGCTKLVVPRDVRRDLGIVCATTR